MRIVYQLGLLFKIPSLHCCYQLSLVLICLSLLKAHSAVESM